MAASTTESSNGSRSKLTTWPCPRSAQQSMMSADWTSPTRLCRGPLQALSEQQLGPETILLSWCWGVGQGVVWMLLLGVGGWLMCWGTAEVLLRSSWGGVEVAFSTSHRWPLSSLSRPVSTLACSWTWPHSHQSATTMVAKSSTCKCSGCNQWLQVSHQPVTAVVAINGCN